MKKIAIVLAGGRGSRMKSSIPKQYMDLNGKPVIYYSLDAFEKSDVDYMILVSGKENIEKCRKDIVEFYGFSKVIAVIEGGCERYDSVYNGLKMIEQLKDKINIEDEDIVLIHDGARPCVTQKIISDCIDDAVTYGACVAAVPVKDTIKITDEKGFAISTPDRKTLWQIQTPQTFKYKIIEKSYKKLFTNVERCGITDDAVVVEKFSNVKVKMTKSDYCNIKITTPEDIKIASEINFKKN